MEDLPRLLRYAGNRNVSSYLKDRFPYPYTERDGREWLDLVLSQDPRTSFCISCAEGLIAGIGLARKEDVYCNSAEIDYWLGEPFWGQGIATLAVRSFTEFAFRRFGLVRIFAGVFESNPASARVLEKAGYQLEGRMRLHVTKENRLMDEARLFVSGRELVNLKSLSEREATAQISVVEVGTAGIEKIDRDVSFRGSPRHGRVSVERSQPGK